MLKIMIVVIFTLMAVLPSFAAEQNSLTDSSFTKQLDSIQTELSEMPEMPSSKYINHNELKDLLRNHNPEIRLAAVKNSKTTIGNSTIQRLVIDIFENDSEQLDIRIEAARALSYGTGASRVISALTDAVKYEDDPIELKVMTYKALWKAASSRSATRRVLVSALKYDEKDTEIRKAVIWSLFAVSRNSTVYRPLVDLLKYGNDDNSIKIEAVKSLYLAMGHSTIRRLITDIAKYNTNPKDKELRKTAILALSGANSSITNRLLEDLFKYNEDTEIREAALEAAMKDPFKINEFFHLNYALGNGSVYNPIEKE